MKCPLCRSKTKVTDSRERGYTVMRKRVCPVCEYGFFTTEILRDEEMPVEHKTSPCGGCAFVCNAEERRDGKMQNYNCFLERQDA